jgi:hypothetical protein
MGRAPPATAPQRMTTASLLCKSRKASQHLAVGRTPKAACRVSLKSRVGGRHLRRMPALKIIGIIRRILSECGDREMKDFLSEFDDSDLTHFSAL